MIFNHCDQLWVIISRNFEILDARLASSLNKIMQNSYFKKRSVRRNIELRKRIGSFAEDRSLT